jgi:hypothetical protein
VACFLIDEADHGGLLDEAGTTPALRKVGTRLAAIAARLEDQEASGGSS